MAEPDEHGTPDEVRIGTARLQLRRGDITQQPDLDVVVNAANAQLTTGGGVAGAIHRAAGPGLGQECAPSAPIRPGECIVTGGHELPNRAVVHCLGPVHGRDEPAEELLASCYRRALTLAADRGYSSIGLPALSTGAFGYPPEPAAEVAIGTVVDVLRGDERLAVVRFVLFSAADLEVHRVAVRRRIDAAPNG